MQHQLWDKHWGTVARKQAKAEEAAKRRVITKAKDRAILFRIAALKGGREETIAYLMDHPEPVDWPDGSVRYSKREGIFIMRDGSGVTQKSDKPVPAKPEVMRRRRNYSAHLKAIGSPGVYFPLTREQAEGLLGP